MIRRYGSLILITAICCAQVYAQKTTGDYSSRWQKVDSLLNKKGLVQSALAEINGIYNTAKKDKNEPQVIKALIYRVNVGEAIQENAIQKSITDIEKEIQGSMEPSRSILTSILAEIYWSYFQRNRWNIYNRTATNHFTKDDLTTWGIADFHQKISTLYLSSVREEKILQTTRLEPFEPIIIAGNSRHLRPALFDLLAHRALDYFKTDESDINKPAYSFEIIDTAALSSSYFFSRSHFNTTDSTSLHYKALILYQHLLDAHISDARPDALIDVDIDRIRFVWEYGRMPDKDSLYLQALKKITDQFPTNPTVSSALYLQAQYYADKAAEYDPLKDTSNRYAYLQSKSICEKVLKQPDSCQGKSDCEILLKNILRKEMQLEAEKVNVPGKPFRVLISYRNIDKIFFRLMRIDKKAKDFLNAGRFTETFWKEIQKLPVIQHFDQRLPVTGDHQNHRVEVKVDAPEPGVYALLGSVADNFATEQNLLSVQYLNISNIAYINNGSDYFVLNRESGQPMPGTDVQAWYRYYDSKTGKYLERKGENFNTDKNGYFKILPPRTNTAGNALLEFSTNSDHLFLDDTYVSYSNDEIEDESLVNKSDYEKENQRTFFFTDRSIYRPGQIVYFKGIIVTKSFDTKQSKILSAHNAWISLYNANNEKIDSVQLTTNEFGSYHAQFKLPENLLTGSFKIADDNDGSEQTFSVEEYKRPRFRVEYKKIIGSYRLNDSINVHGIARAYAGNNIDGAMVKYRVSRQARFPYPWLSRWGMQRVARQEISHGEIKTATDGSFNIGFVAIPDLAVKKALDPVFEYRVIADITDVNGETRTSETTVSIGYKALLLSVETSGSDQLPADSIKNLSIRSVNLSGEFEPAWVHLTIYSLKSPDRLIRERYWQKPDQFLTTRDEYLNYFPNDEYDDETNKEGWPKTKVYETSDSTKRNGHFNLQSLSSNSQPGLWTGWYLLETTTKDKYGQEVKSLKYIELYDARQSFLGSPQYLWTITNTESVEPGKSTTLTIGSSARDIFLIQQTEKDKSSYTFSTLSSEKKSFSFGITDADRGGFGVNYAFVKNNRFFTSSHTVAVPWTNKELNVSYTTYRDKTIPGSEEKWKVNIAGQQRDKIAVEMLASMYDASLDQFRQQSWVIPDIYPVYGAVNHWNGKHNFLTIQSVPNSWNDFNITPFQKTYDKLLPIQSSMPRLLATKSYEYNLVTAKGMELADVTVAGYGPQMRKEIQPAGEMVMEQKSKDQTEKDLQPPIQIRKNFNETAFFFPDLRTDDSGNVEFSFTIPEALTQWKWMSFAHSKDLAMGYSEKSIITQKQLMLQPNIPRFIRQGDHLELPVKIVNLSDSELTGQAQLQLLDPVTNQPVDGWFSNRQPNQYFTAAAGQSTIVSFPIDVPFQYNQALNYRIIAKAGAFSDGEESTLPVLSNRMRVTESIPLNMRGSGTKNFKFEKLLQSGSSETLSQDRLTVEFTSNPAWYAVQALPYLMEYPYECAEQTFNRFYANALASKIANTTPKIREIFERWKTDTSTLLSNLQKNEELKSVLLQETPWMLEAKSEAAQKKNLGLLLDMVRMNAAMESALNKLQGMQSAGGGFPWFKEGPDDRYITQYILTGIGHLEKLNALSPAMKEKLHGLIQKAIGWADQKIKTDYEEEKKRKVASAGGLNNIAIQYLYMRSFFSSYAIPGASFAAVDYYRKQSQHSWLQGSRYMQGMIALSLFRTGDIKTARDIIASLKEHAIVSEELGMYWKDVTPGYYWYQAPVETQALLIEAFTEISRDTETINGLRTWLLKQKQTSNWASTKATAEACYALLMQGTDWLAATTDVQIRLGDQLVASEKSNGDEGYFKKTIDGSLIKPAMGNIAVTLSSPNGGGWEGAIYWQYFEDLDKISSTISSSNPLKISRKLFIRKNTDRGVVLEPVPDNGAVQVGDKITVRIELRTDRDMEYVHMKDMRASCMEPVNVLSAYQWKGGLGYYEATKDASTNFFFNWLPKGTHIFEYELFVTNAGSFSNGITTIQCMYAPEFMSHSEGIRINVE